MTLDEIDELAKAKSSPEEQAVIDLQIRIFSGEKIKATNAVDQVNVDRLVSLVSGLGVLVKRLTGYLETKGMSKEEIGGNIYGGVKLEAEPYDPETDGKAFADMVLNASVVALGKVTEAHLKEHRGPVACLYRSINASLDQQLRQAGIIREKIRDEILKTIKAAVAAKPDRAKHSKSTLP